MTRLSFLKLFGVSFTLVGFLFFTTSCTKRKSSAQNQVLNWSNGGEPKDIDPQTVVGNPEHHITAALFEGLVDRHPATPEIVPAGATEWTISSDKKTYTFKLRKEAKWSNGEVITAADYVYSFQRLVAPATASEWAHHGAFIKNGKEITAGEIKDLSKYGVRAVDDFTFEVTLVRPTPYILEVFAHPSCFVVPKKAIEAHGIKWTRPGNLVGNGAFILDKWEMNKVISVIPNPTYWDKERVKLKQVNFVPVKDDTEEKMFRAGELQIAESIPLEKLPFWRADKSGVYNVHPFWGIYYYIFNVKKAPFDKPEVRKALTLAIDRTRITELVLKGSQLPLESHASPGIGGYNAKSYYPKDLSKLTEAKALLAKAGYPEGKGMPPIELLYNTQDAHKKVAETIQSMLKENLGVQITLVNQEWKVFLDTKKQHQFMMARQGWTADYGDATTFMDMWRTGNPLNEGQFSNQIYDKKMKEVDEELDIEKRKLLLSQAEDILAENVPALPVYVYVRNFLMDTRVKGWSPNIADRHPLKYVSFEVDSK